MVTGMYGRSLSATVVGKMVHAERPNLSQSTLARGWEDTKRGLGSWQFWALEVFGAGLLAIITEDPAVALIFVAGMLAALWLGATARAPFHLRKEQAEYIEKLEGELHKHCIEISGEANPFSDDGYDLFVSVHNPTVNTVKIVAASLMEIISGPEIDQREKIQTLIGVPLSPVGKRDHHKPTPEHLDIHPSDTSRFEIGRVHFVPPSSRSKSHIALAVAETTPLVDPNGRTWYSLNVDRGIHFPNEGEWEIRIVIRGQDIKPKQVSFFVNFDTQTVTCGG